MEEQENNRSFFTGVVVGALLGGCVAALMSTRNTSEVPEYVIERGLELKNHTEDALQRAQQTAHEALAKVRANT